MKILNRVFYKEAPEAYGGAIKDNRKDKRYSLPIAVRYEYARRALSGETLTADISKKGMRLRIEYNIERGAEVDFVIEDPFSNKRIRSKGRIVWSKRSITGDDAGRAFYEIGVRLARKIIY